MTTDDKVELLLQQATELPEDPRPSLSNCSSRCAPSTSQSTAATTTSALVSPAVHDTTVSTRFDLDHQSDAMLGPVRCLRVIITRRFPLRDCSAPAAPVKATPAGRPLATLTGVAGALMRSHAGSGENAAYAPPKEFVVRHLPRYAASWRSSGLPAVGHACKRRDLTRFAAGRGAIVMSSPDNSPGGMRGWRERYKPLDSCMIWLLKPDHPKTTEFAPAMAEGTGILPGLPAVGGKPVHVAFRRRPADLGCRHLVAVGGRAAAQDRRAAGRLPGRPARPGPGAARAGRDDPLPRAADRGGL